MDLDKSNTNQSPSSRLNIFSPFRRLNRRWVVVATLFVIAVVATFVIRAKFINKIDSSLVTATATIGDIEQTVLATGTLKPVKLVAVGAQVSGRLTALHVTLGQTVKAGDLIAEIDSLTQQNTLRTNEAALRHTQAQRDEKLATLVLQEANLSRQQMTFAQKASSRAEFDAADANVKQTKAQIAQLDAKITEAEIAIETAKVNLGYTKVTAPIDGTVLSIGTQQGQTVNAVQSAPTIVVLGQVDTMVARVEISEADVVRVKPGQKVYFTILGEPGHRFEAQLGSVEPAPESVKSDSSFSTTSASSSSSSSTTSAVYYNGVFSVANPDHRLMTYMTAEVHILLGEAHQVLTVPSSSLGRANHDGTYTVSVVDDSGAAVKRSIRIGLNNKITAEVQSGLREGERVVIASTNDITSKSPMMPPPPRGM